MADDINEVFDENDEIEVKPKASATTAKKGTKTPKRNARKGDEKKSGGIKGFFIDIFSELRKVIWPTRGELVKQTITVIFTSAIIGAVIIAFDFAFQTGHGWLMELIK